MNEKYGKVLIILLILIIIVPKLSQMLIGSTISVFGLSLNDSFLLLLSIIFMISMIIIFWPRPDLSVSERRFRKLYKPRSDLERVRNYIKERLDSGDSKQKILFVLRKVGWSEDIIQTAFDTAGKARVIKISPKKKIRRRRKPVVKKKTKKKRS